MAGSAPLDQSQAVLTALTAALRDTDLSEELDAVASPHIEQDQEGRPVVHDGDALQTAITAVAKRWGLDFPLYRYLFERFVLANVPKYSSDNMKQETGAAFTRVDFEPFLDGDPLPPGSRNPPPKDIKKWLDHAFLTST